MIRALPSTSLTAQPAHRPSARAAAGRRPARSAERPRVIHVDCRPRRRVAASGYMASAFRCYVENSQPAGGATVDVRV